MTAQLVLLIEQPQCKSHVKEAPGVIRPGHRPHHIVRLHAFNLKEYNQAITQTVRPGRKSVYLEG
jgi:hypothetical protein